MADLKISQLTGATTPLAGTEVLPIVQGGATKQVSVANLTAGRAVATAGGSFTDNITQSTANKGVNFTANTPAAGMTSQLLNWYEEGNWTPSVGGSATYKAQTGKYTRIGRQVTLYAELWINVLGTGSSSAVTGLPFSVGAINYAGSVGPTSNLAITVASISVETYNNTLYFPTRSTAGAFTEVSAIFKDDARIFFNITYFV